MPERHPNVDVHLYQDRHGRWRARINVAIRGVETTLRVPSPESTGYQARLQVLIAVDDALGLQLLAEGWC